MPIYTSAPAALNLDSAIHRINSYPVDKYKGNQLRYTTCEQPGPGRKERNRGTFLLKEKTQQQCLTTEL